MAARRAGAEQRGVPRLRDFASDVPRSRDATKRASRLALLGASASQDGVDGRSGGPRRGEERLPSLVSRARAITASPSRRQRWAGTRATVYLRKTRSCTRARIEALGARVAWTSGTYDDAVERAAYGDGLLIADTSTYSDDQVVRDVMDGHG